MRKNLQKWRKALQCLLIGMHLLISFESSYRKLTVVQDQFLGSRGHSYFKEGINYKEGNFT